MVYRMVLKVTTYWRVARENFHGFWQIHKCACKKYTLVYARPIYRPVQAYNSENKCFLPIITAKAVVYIHINIYELSYAA